MMHDREKSGSAIVAGKPTNKAGQSVAESVEPRAEAEGNAGEQSTLRAQDRDGVSQALDRVRQAARLRKKEKFTALLHHVSVDLLRQAFLALKRDAAAGVDGLTWRTYAADLDRNLTDLHARVHRGAYRALPSRRTYIPKADGRQRSLAVAALEDKIVQRATVAVLNSIYEEDFLGFSYGFRPKRGQHDTLDALCVGITTRRVNFIFDADVRSFFDEVSQSWLIRFVEHRVGDPRIIRLIRKWLKAGVLEDGVVTVSDKGTGQGAVISPLLANVYLHYVFDLWAERWRRCEATGDMVIVRYADDLVVGFEHETDARRFWDAMRNRLEEFSLSLHPDKTRLIEFGRHAADRRARRGLGKPETFNFLGFTFICGHSRSGKFLLKRKTRRDRMRAKLREIKEELRRRMHQPIPEQGRWLAQVVRGFFAYHAVPTNFSALSAFHHHIKRLWLRTLRRRSQKDRTTWERIKKIAADYLPKPRTLHPWPQQRFAVKHPRWEPRAGIPLARFCAGGGR
jgi:group II intron reverse transcriptase/maturase